MKIIFRLKSKFIIILKHILTILIVGDLILPVLLMNETLAGFNENIKRELIVEMHKSEKINEILKKPEGEKKKELIRLAKEVFEKIQKEPSLAAEDLGSIPTDKAEINTEIGLVVLEVAGFKSFSMSEHLVSSQSSGQLKMGIEIETPKLKLQLGKQERMGLTVSRKGRDIWRIEDDTLDKTATSTGAMPVNDRNLECKTIGGFSVDEQALLMRITKDIENILNFNDMFDKDDLIKITPKLISYFINKGKSIDDQLQVTFDEHDKTWLTVKVSDKDPIIRPQITYQVSLNLIPQIFDHFKGIHDDIRDFLSCLNPTLVLKSPDKPMKTTVPSGNAYQKAMIRFLVNEKFKDNKIIKNLDEHPFLKGFTYIFLFYWHQLFNNNEMFTTSEPGLKQYLALMSRVPFSSLFESLTPEEKRIFKEVLGPIINEHGSKYKLRQYVTDYVVKGSERKAFQTDLSLKKWYESVISSDGSEWRNNRQLVRYSDGSCKRVDLLSPPPGLLTKYQQGLSKDETEIPDSMGAMEAEKHNGLALIEARGYNKVEGTGPKKALVFDDVLRFVKGEASWFFDLK